MDVLNALRVVLLAALGAATLIGPASAASSLNLAPGVVVSADLTRAFVSASDGRVQAIELDGGRIAWTSMERASPLALVDGRLLALGSVEQSGLGMVLLLDPASGDARDRIAFDLPETVSADLFPQPSRSFAATLSETGGGLRLHWRYRGRPLRGALIATDAEGEPDVGQATELEGAVDLLLGGSRAYAVPLRDVVDYPPTAAPDLAASEQLPGIVGRQFRAADSQHVLASQGEEVAGGLNRWTVYARTGGTALGSLQSAYAYAPFVVAAGQLVYLAAPQQSLDADGRLTELPMRLVGHDLGDGRERWSVAVLDPQFRGPFPP